MTIDADIRDQAYQFFIQEAPELLYVIETELVNLVQERSTNKIHNMMRAAHSLKGGAASVGLPVISQLSHRLEDFFKTLHHEDLIIDHELESLLLEAFDLLRLSLNQQIDTGSIDPDHIAEVAAPILTNIEDKLGHFLGSETELPNSVDLGVDIALSIFEVDIAEGLESLRNILDHPQDRVVAGELRAQSEVFIGIAELLNMPGLGDIAQATITALNANPSMVTEIAHYAIQDFEAARQAVIAGDRTQGGHPSPQLVALANPQSPLSEFNELDDLLAEQPSDLDSDLDLLFAEAPSPESNEYNFEANPDPDQLFADEAIAGSDFNLDALFDSAGEFSLADRDQELNENIALTAEQGADLDDIFGGEEITAIENNLALDDLFGDSELPFPENADESDEFLAEQISSPDAESQSAVFDLDDVFGNEADQEDLGDRNNLLLDDVFGETLPLEDLSDSTSIQELTTQETEIPTEIIAISPEPTEPISKPTTIAPIKAPNYTPKPVTSTSLASDSQLSVRINLDRLEQMNNLVGELVINRNVLAMQNEQLQGIIQELLSRFNKFRQITQRLRAISDQTASSDRYRASGNITNTREASNDNFDSLELDTYTELYGVMQAALEDLAQIEETVEDVTLLSGQSTQTLEQQRQTVIRLRDDLVWARMLPLSEVLNRFPRNIRDLSSKYKKPVDLKLSGTGVLVDKAILEKLYDPLQHLLRNAFDHGIEASDIRIQQEKSARGQIEIRAYHQGSQTVIEVRDDGQGINLEQIRRKAVAQALISDTQVLTNPQLLDLMFQPGFSTAEQVSELSGRGVGLDVVRSQIQSLKGTVSVAFEQGHGTTFTLKIPLTLSIANLLIFVVGASVFAIASSSIEEIVVPKLSQVTRSEGKRLLHWREQTIPIRHLSEFLDFRCPLPESLPNTSLISVPTPSDWALPLLIIRRNQEILALEIDRLVTEQELAIKPLGKSISPPKFIYGCTILGDGSLIPILDGQEILGQVSLATPITPKSKVLTSQSETLLIVDDSIALRQTLALTLQKVGFRVLQAKDGQEAIEQLEKNSTIQLVICDVEMPIMNGFEFLTHRRQNPQLNKTPVVMLTSRSSDKHRRLAMHLGASSYFTKPYLEREFIAAIKDMLSAQSPVKSAT